MLVNEKQKKFMQLRILEGKSFSTISKEIGVPIETLHEWDLNLTEEMENIRMNELDIIEEESGLAPIAQLRYLAKLYSRLREELNSRDFSGLPTDELYHILNDVEQRFNHKMRALEDDFDDDFDVFDDIDNWDDDDDEYF